MSSSSNPAHPELKAGSSIPMPKAGSSTPAQSRVIHPQLTAGSSTTPRLIHSPTPSKLINGKWQGCRLPFATWFVHPFPTLLHPACSQIELTTGKWQMASGRGATCHLAHPSLAPCSLSPASSQKRMWLKYWGTLLHNSCRAELDCLQSSCRAPVWAWKLLRSSCKAPVKLL